MIEVFKTNVTSETEAMRLLDKIHHTYSHCQANFDLSDCDNILRVEGVRSERDIFSILTLVKENGYQAEVLPDDTNSGGGTEQVHDTALAHS